MKLRHVLKVITAASFILGPANVVRAQEIGRQFLALTVPYPVDGISLGQGWDSVLNQRVETNCLNFSETPIERSSFRIETTEVKDSYAFKEARSRTVGGGGKGFGVKVSMSRTTSQSKSLNTDFLNYVISYQMDYGGTYIAAPQPPTVTLPWVEKNNVIVPSAVSLSEEAKAALTSEGGVQKFTKQCGDYFVSAIHRGARIDVLATYFSSNRVEQEAVKLSVSAKGFGASASMTDEQSKSQGFSNSKFQYTVYQEGGGPPTIATRYEDIIKSIDPVAVVQNPVAYLITLTPYAALPGWQLKAGKVSNISDLTPYTPQSLADLDRMYSAYLDLYRLLEGIDANTVAKDLQSTGVLVANTELGQDYSAVTIDIFGGQNKIRAVKTQIQRYLFVLERVFDYCFTQRNCNEAEATKKIAQDLKSLLEELVKRSSVTDKSTAQNIVNASVEDVGNFINEDSSPEVVGIFNARRNLDTLNRIVDGENGLFADEFYMDFYRILASIPLPTTVFEPISISKQYIGGEPDLSKRKDTLLGILQRAIMFHRVSAWNKEFCVSAIANRMCRFDTELWNSVASASLTVKDEHVPLPDAPPPPPPPPPPKIKTNYPPECYPTSKKQCP